MTDEDIPAQAALPDTAGAAPMTPMQALTTGFDIGTSGSGRSGPGSAMPEGISLAGHGESRQGFRIGDVGLMIRYEDSSELADMPDVHRLPNAPAWFYGIANLRGKLTPVVDLAGYIDVGAVRGAKRMLLVLAHGRDATGVVIDGLPERLRWSGEEPGDTGVAPKKLAPHLRGARNIGGRLWFDLDTHSLLDEIEHSLGSPQ